MIDKFNDWADLFFKNRSYPEQAPSDSVRLAILLRNAHYLGVRDWEERHTTLTSVSEARKHLDEQEKKVIEQFLTAQGWNITKTAEMLGVSRYALQRRIRKFHLRIVTT